MLAILEARRRIGRRIRSTPLVAAPWLAPNTESTSTESGTRSSGGATGASWLKLENLQRGHSFKIRGALNAVLAIAERQPSGTTAERRAAPPQVVTASAGNHGLALADAATEAGMTCTVFTPADAARTKLEAIRATGAQLHTVAGPYDEAEAAAKVYAESSGAIYISPYNDRDVIAGAGTIGLEILEAVPDVEVVVVPVGGGGLVSGIGSAIKTLAPRCRIVGVEAALNPAFMTVRRHGRGTRIPVHPTLADGLGGNVDPESITLPLVERFVDDLVAVSEREIASAIAHLARIEHLIVEGAGAVGVAAVAGGHVETRDRRVVVVVSGGNIDAERLAHLISTSTPSSRR